MSYQRQTALASAGNRPDIAQHAPSAGTLFAARHFPRKRRPASSQPCSGSSADVWPRSGSAEGSKHPEKIEELLGCFWQRERVDRAKDSRAHTVTEPALHHPPTAENVVNAEFPMRVPVVLGCCTTLPAAGKDHRAFQQASHSIQALQGVDRAIFPPASTTGPVHKVCARLEEPARALVRTHGQSGQDHAAH